MRITRKDIRGILKRSLNEARYGGRAKDKAGKWKQGDALNLYNADEDDYNPDDDYIPEEIQEFMSDSEKEDFLAGDDSPTGPATYTLDDIVDTNILQTKSAPGTKAFIDNTLDTLKTFLSDEDFMDEMIDIKESGSTFNDFEAVRDAALEVWIPSATKILGQDASKLPELSDNSFMKGFLYDFWFIASYVKPALRQVRKGKDNAETFRNVADRWKYMNDVNKASDFVKNVLTPAFTYLTRDTSVAG